MRMGERGSKKMSSKVPIVKLRGGVELLLCFLVIGFFFFYMSKSGDRSVVLVSNEEEYPKFSLEEEFCTDRRFSVDEVMRHPTYFDDPRIVQHVREHLLIPPSTQPYNLNKTEEEHYTEHGIEDFFEAMFGDKKDRIFIEAGASDGEIGSTSLFLEKNYHWTGLLVEADPVYIQQIKKKHRKAWIAPVCLSPAPTFGHINFIQMLGAPYQSHLAMDFIKKKKMWLCPSQQDPSKSQMVVSIPDSIAEANHCKQPQERTIKLPCFSLYTLMLSANYTTVDLLSLSLGGAELHVLASLPYENINIKVLVVAIDSLDDAETLVAFMKLKGFNRIRKVGKYLLSEELPQHLIFLRDSYKVFPLP